MRGGSDCCLRDAPVAIPEGGYFRQIKPFIRCAHAGLCSLWLMKASFQRHKEQSPSCLRPERLNLSGWKMGFVPPFYLAGCVKDRVCRFCLFVVLSYIQNCHHFLLAFLWASSAVFLSFSAAILSSSSKISGYCSSALAILSINVKVARQSPKAE